MFVILAVRLAPFHCSYLPLIQELHQALFGPATRVRPATKKAESATNKSEETCYFEKAAFGVLFLPPMKKFRILIICEEVNLICDGLTHPHPQRA